MSPDDVTPERLDAILDGREAPRSDEEREVLLLAASLREGSPRAGDELRARVRALPDAHQARGRLRRLAGSGWRARALVAAPALAAAIAAVVAVGVFRGGDTGSGRVAETRQPTPSATTVAPLSSAGADASVPSGAAVADPAVPGGAESLAAGTRATLRVAPGTLRARVREASRLVERAGGTVELAAAKAPVAGVVLLITLTPERAAATLAALAGLGTAATAITADPAGRASVLITESR